MTPQTRRRFLGLALTVLVSPHAFAFPGFFAAFQDEYPGTTLPAVVGCGICHVRWTGGGTRNLFGMAFEDAGYLFSPIEGLDSDGDGWVNLSEINADLHPGDPAFQATTVDAFLFADPNQPPFDAPREPDVNRDGAFDVADMIAAGRAEASLAGN
ncbi:MAG: hypothetical protein RLY93_09190 [Sumerlaeia bacterium]